MDPSPRTRALARRTPSRVRRFPSLCCTCCTALVTALVLPAAFATTARAAGPRAVEAPGPQVTITSPMAGGSYRGVYLDVSVVVTPTTLGPVTTTATLGNVAIAVPDHFPSDNLAPGTHTLVVTATDQMGDTTTRSLSFSTTPLPPAPGQYYQGQVYHTPAGSAIPPKLVASGDIACATQSNTVTPDTCQQAATAALVQSLNPSAVAELADAQYNNTGEGDTLSAFMQVYNPSWGAFKAITHPAAGNHEYSDATHASGANYPGARADGYYDYFNGVGNQIGPAGDRDKGYYSYDLGSWHVVVLNSECGVVSCVPGSGQQEWLQADLVAHPVPCTLAYWHEPLFTTGVTQGGENNLASRDLWRTLYAHGVTLILNGHDHNYQRFAPQTPDGVSDPTQGIREFVLGEGGKSHFGLPNKEPNIEVSDAATFGVLQLTLKAGGYDWTFVPVPSHGNGTFTDQGSGACVGAPTGPGGGGGAATPELGSAELLATALVPLAAALVYRRRRARPGTDNSSTSTTLRHY